ncbi:MAG: hypothetical protein V8Q84_11570 [Bilophila sp.]
MLAIERGDARAFLPAMPEGHKDRNRPSSRPQDAEKYQNSAHQSLSVAKRAEKAL